jgi:hypothetical protein
MFIIDGVWISGAKLDEFTTIFGFWSKVLTWSYEVGYK